MYSMKKMDFNFEFAKDYILQLLHYYKDSLEVSIRWWKI